MESSYYEMPLSYTNFIIWLVITILLTLITAFSGFILLLIPLLLWIDLKKRKYKYNDEKIIVEKGILNKKQYIIPLYRIITIESSSVLWQESIIIKDKGQEIKLDFVKEGREETLKLTEKWEQSKKSNIRNEVI